MIWNLILLLVMTVSTAVFAAFPILGISMLVFMSTIETGRIPAFGTDVPLPAAVLIVFLCSALLRLMLSRQIHREWLAALVFLLVTFLFSGLICIHPLAALKEIGTWLGYAAAAYFIGLYWPQPNSNPYVTFPFRASVLAALALALIQVWLSTRDSPVPVQAGFTESGYFVVFLSWMTPFVLLAFHKAQTSREEGFWTGVFLSILWISWMTGPGREALLLLFTVLLCGIARLMNREMLLWLAPLAAVGLLHGLQGHDFGMWKSIQPWLPDQGPSNFAESGLSALGIWSTHPFLGTGPGQYESYVRWAYPETAGSIGSPGSTLLLILAESGILGVLAFSWILGLLFAGWYDARCVPHLSSDEKRFMRAAIVSLVMLAASSMIYNIHTHYFSWCFIGILFGCFRDQGVMDQNKSWKRP